MQIMHLHQGETIALTNPVNGGEALLYRHLRRILGARGYLLGLK